MHHKNIKRFGLDGSIGDDKDFIKSRESFTHMILEEMRDSGYVPVLDLGPLWSTSWNGESFDFVLSLYGVHVGMRKAREIEGYDGYGVMYKRK